MRAQQQGGDLYLEGIITAPVEDAEGGVYRPEKMDLAALVREGYLDVNHMMFEHGISEAVIGSPVEIRNVKDGVWARFKLNGSRLAQDIWNYVQQNPGVLGFSIAGGLLKPLFERGGEWLFDAAHGGSVGICRFPMNPATSAFATSLAATSSLTHNNLLRVMRGVANDLLAKKINIRASYDEWYGYYAESGCDPLASSTLATWSSHYFCGLADSADLIETIKAAVIVPAEDESEVRSMLEGQITHWLAAHPHDEHFTTDGRFRTLDDAISHYRYCERLSPIQTAKILGYLRNHTDLLSHVPKSWVVNPIG